jgi:hypothetical protein
MGRPCDIYRLDANSFFFTDDNKGIIYYVRKKGWETKVASSADIPVSARAELAGADASVAPAENKGFCLSFAVVLAGAFFSSFK